MHLTFQAFLAGDDPEIPVILKGDLRAGHRGDVGKGREVLSDLIGEDGNGLLRSFHLRNDAVGTVLDQAGERLLRRHAIDERPEADALDEASKKIADSFLHGNRLSLLKCGDLPGQPIQPALKPLGGLAGYREDPEFGIEGKGVFFCLFHVKIHIGHQVDLVEDQHR